MNFPDFVKLSRKSNSSTLRTEHMCILALDPGNTTGYAQFVANDIVNWGQLKTGTVPNAVQEIERLLTDPKYPPTLVVFEEYRIYGQKAKAHINSDVLTLRIIGAIETLCTLNQIPYVRQSASTAKGFCTDKKLEEWGYWKSGLRHARDAIRHACYFLLFGKLDQ